MKIRGQIIDIHKGTKNNLNMRRNRNFLDTKKETSPIMGRPLEYTQKEIKEHRQMIQDKLDQTTRLNTKLGLLFIVFVILFSYWGYIIFQQIVSNLYLFKIH